MWVTRPERPKGAKHEVKRPEGPPARSLLIRDNLFSCWCLSLLSILQRFCKGFLSFSVFFYQPRLSDLCYTLNIQRSLFFVFLCRFLSTEGNFIQPAPLLGNRQPPSAAPNYSKHWTQFFNRMKWLDFTRLYCGVLRIGQHLSFSWSVYCKWGSMNVKSKLLYCTYIVWL